MRKKMTAPWIRKHCPTSADEVPQHAAIAQVRQFIETFKTQKKKAVLLHGPPGSCKTCAAYALANEFNLEVLEVNASDVRNKEQIQAKLGNALKQQSLFHQGKLILVDEIDGVAGSADRGGVSAIASLIGTSSFPIILTANNPWHSKFSPIRSKAKLIEFGTLNYLSIVKVLRRICEREQITAEDTVLKTLARRVGGDLRAAINDLQSLARKTKQITAEHIDELSDRNRVESIMQALVKILKGTDPHVAVSAFDSVEEDIDKCFLWVDENLPKEYQGKDLARAYDALSSASMFKGRIRRQQYWRLLTYVNTLMTAGVAVAKDAKQSGFTKYQPPTRILKLWRAKQKYHKRNAIAEKIAAQTHCSTKRALHATLPYLQVIFQKNPDAAEAIADTFEFDEDEVSWLMAS